MDNIQEDKMTETFKKLRNIKNKKSQGVFDMSFNMIFSIIIIVFFIVVAFIAIRYFLNYQKCTQVGMFLQDFNSEVSKAFNSEKASYSFNSTLPGAVEAVCIFDASLGLKNASALSREAYDYIKTKEVIDYKSNVYIYSPEKEYCVKWKKIENIKTTNNPYCIPVINGKISLKLQREFQNPYVLIK